MEKEEIGSEEWNGKSHFVIITPIRIINERLHFGCNRFDNKPGWPVGFGILHVFADACRILVGEANEYFIGSLAKVP